MLTTVATQLPCLGAKMQSSKKGISILSMSPVPKPKRKRILRTMGVREFPRGLSAAAPSGRMVEPQAGAVGVMATI